MWNVSIDAGDAVYFSAEGTDPDSNLPLSYYWTFGTGSGIASSTEKTPGLVRFNTPGQYTVAMTVADGLGLADATPAEVTVTVVSPQATLLSQADWSLRFVDSQELVGEDGSAANAIDGNPGTMWQTDWYVYSLVPPHEVQIDLGGLYRVNEFRYLPRQDGSEGGWVSQYEIYVSTDAENWGSPVASGTFASSSAEKVVSFSATVGQYVRFRSVGNDVGGNPWASAAELRVVGSSVKPSVRLVKPLDHHLQTGADLHVRAGASLDAVAHSDLGVRLLLDGGPLNGGQFFDAYSAPFETTFAGLGKGEHWVDAVMIDASGNELSTFETRDRSSEVGVGDFYVAMGDSITAGLTGDGDDYPADDTSLDGRNTGGGYTPILNNLLTAARGTPNTIVNHGFGGVTSAYGVSLIPVLLKKYPDSQYYLIFYGMNDARPWLPVPSGKGLKPGDTGYPGSFKDNMQRIIDAVKGAGKSPILAKINVALPVTGERNLLIEEYNVVIEELVSDPANNVTVQPPDFHSYYAQHYPTEYLDSIHPNGIGYQSMARLWCEMLTGGSCGGQ
jgi:lysophospholipase L1-like esterase